MKYTFIFSFVLLLLLAFACYKERSYEGGKRNLRDTLPLDYPFACGLCQGVTLGVEIIDTVMYSPDTTGTLPSSFDLNMPTPGNQGSQGSCAAWAVVYGAGNFYTHNASGNKYNDINNLSPTYTYNQITKGNCTCTSLLDNLYLLKTQGACSVTNLPYNPLECATQPDSIQREQAAPNKINGWAKLNLHNLSLIKKAIARKHPVLFGIHVNDEFNHLSSPFIWQSGEGDAARPHALLLTGYNDSLHAFRLMNSWSTGWADGGFAWIDYDYFLKNVMEDGYIVL